MEALGLCVNHYRMNQKHGSPVAERPLYAILRGKTSEERFFYSVEKTDGCWNWKASKDKDGYGRFRGDVGGVMYFDAHRFSWAYFNLELIPPNMMVMHKCDNPSCVNPDHLMLGSAQDNSMDMVSKGRAANGLRNARTGTKLNEVQVRAIAADERRYDAIAAEYNVQKQCVFDIKNRKTWAHLEDLVIHKNPRGARGTERSKSLTEDDVRAIRSSEETTVALARKYGMSPPTICDIRYRRSWNHVT